MNKVKQLIYKYDFNIKKSLGQNFLVDNNLIKKLISLMDLNNNNNIIELGTGFGSITYPIAEIVNKVITFEIDKHIYEILVKENDSNNITFINKDILEIDFNEIKNLDNLVIVGNLPYYISSEILKKLILDDVDVNIYLMLQKEVVLKLLENNYNANYKAISVLIQSLFDCKVLLDVSPACFFPKPNVDSSFVRLYRKNIKINRKEYLNFIKIIFENRRKTLNNNLKKYYDKDKIDKIYYDLGLSCYIRVEQLDVKTIIKIYEVLNED